MLIYTKSDVFTIKNAKLKLISIVVNVSKIFVIACLNLLYDNIRKGIIPSSNQKNEIPRASINALCVEEISKKKELIASIKYFLNLQKQCYHGIKFLKMARTPSKMIDLGSKLPDFNLINTINNQFFDHKKLNNEIGTLVMFICNHCPFVIHVLDEIIAISKFYKGKINIVAISSNDVINYPQDSPLMMKKLATNKNFDFPYLYDESQNIAKAFDAACTPDFFLYDEEKKLVYRGQLDDSRPGNDLEITGNDLRNAIDCTLNNEENNSVQKPSIGCNIKWKDS